MMNINLELSKNIERILNRDPKCEEEQIVSELIALPTLRLKKQSIKIGVREFMRAKVKREPAGDPVAKNSVESFGLDRPRKKVKNQSFLEQMEFIDHPEEYRFDHIGGLKSTIAEIFSSVISCIVEPKLFKELNIQKVKGFLLGGPIGCGKTLLSMCLLSYLKNTHKLNCYYLNSGCLTTGGDSEEKVRKLFECLNAKQPSIVVFDDLEQLSQKELKKIQGCSMNTLLSELDKCRHQDIFFVGTTCNPQKIDVAAKKVHRFQKYINVDCSGDQARLEILTKMLSKVKNDLKGSQIKQIVDCTPGFMGADLDVLIRESGLQCLRESQSSMPSPKVDVLGGGSVSLSYRHLKCALKNVQPVLKKQGFTDIPKTTLEDIGGLTELKKQLEREIIIPIKRKTEFQQMNFQLQSGGVLLYGPPGCGKTMLAKAIANAVQANFIIVKGPQLLNKYVGESEQAVRQVFGKAQRAAPCVIFFDEFDALAPKRCSQGNQVTERVVNTLLTALDGVQQRKMVFVIAATNRKDMIDDAILRSGRIQKHLYVPQPDSFQRHDILNAITKDISLAPEVSFEPIAKATEGLSGADLRFLVKEAVVSAVVAQRKTISMEDFNRSLSEILRVRETQRSEAQANMIQRQQLQVYFDEGPPPNSKQKTEELKAESQHSNDMIGQFIEFLVRRKKKQTRTKQS